MQVVDARAAVDASAALYGWSVTSDPTYTYLYAHCHRQFGWDPFPFVNPPVYVHDFNCVQRMTVARIPRGQFDAPLQYWNGSSWGSNPTSAANVVPGGRLVDASQMYYVAPGKYVAITKVGDWFGQTIEIDVRVAATGPVQDGAHHRGAGGLPDLQQLLRDDPAVRSRRRLVDRRPVEQHLRTRRPRPVRPHVLRDQTGTIATTGRVDPAAWVTVTVAA